jgi:hypothetical protein
MIRGAYGGVTEMHPLGVHLNLPLHRTEYMKGHSIPGPNSKPAPLLGLNAVATSSYQ